MEKKKVAVFFGGKSFEHDISILTGINVCNAIDSTKFDVFPIYVDLFGQFWYGNLLLDKNFYPLNIEKQFKLKKLNLVIGKRCLSKKNFYFKTQKQSIFEMTHEIDFDIAFLAFHGNYGEIGYFQGLCEIAGIPYTGCGVKASSIFMDKSLTKQIAKKLDIPVLEEKIIEKPKNNDFFNVEILTDGIQFGFPMIVKPNSLGSSIGVSKANNKEELDVAILKIFALGDDVLLEPFVENLEEYNVSVTKIFGHTQVSVIERPFKKNNIFLDFKEKYLGDGTKNGTKNGTKCGVKGAKFGDTAGSMISLSRVYNPEELTDEEKNNIKTWAKNLFDSVGGNGDPRIDFICNSKTREIYLCEVNPIPGSLAYYLWENSEEKILQSELLTGLIEEAELKSYKSAANIILSESKIFKEK